LLRAALSFVCVYRSLSQCEDHQLQLRLGSFQNFTLLSLVFFVFRPLVVVGVFCALVRFVSTTATSPCFTTFSAFLAFGACASRTLGR